MEDNLNFKQVIELDEETLLVFLEKMYARFKSEHQEEDLSWIKESEACKILGCGKTKIWQLRGKGLITYAKLERHVLYNRDSLYEYINANTYKSLKL